MLMPRFVAHLKRRGAHVLFNTNAVLLGLDERRVSLDAATPALYHKLRGIDKFNQIVANLRAFIARHGAGETHASHSGSSACRRICISCRILCAWRPS
jgi:hypothetical protein